VTENQILIHLKKASEKNQMRAVKEQSGALSAVQGGT